jgi:hypothetical protein
MNETEKTADKIEGILMYIMSGSFLVIMGTIVLYLAR